MNTSDFTQGNPHESRNILDLVNKAIQAGGEDVYRLESAFSAVDLGLRLGWDIMRLQDSQERQDKGWVFKTRLDGFNVSPYANMEVYEGIKRVGFNVPGGYNNGFIGDTLRSHSGGLIKDAFESVWKDHQSLGIVLDNHIALDVRDGWLGELERQQLYDAHVIGEVVADRVREGKSPLPEGGVAELFVEDSHTFGREREF